MTGRQSTPTVLRGHLAARRKNANILAATTPKRAVKLSLSETWQLYFYVNRLKVLVYLRRVEAGTVKREKKWLEKLLRCWAEGALDTGLEEGVRAEDVSWKAQSLCYMCIMPWTAGSYVGETRRGLIHRVQQHLNISRKQLKGKMTKFHRQIRRLGTCRTIWLPVSSWSAGTTKHQRLKQEAELIETFDTSWNGTGVKAGPMMEGRFGEVLLMGKRKEFRDLVKFRRRRGEAAVIHTGGEVADTGNERRRRKAMAAWVARLIRRPLKKQRNFDELGIVKKLRSMHDREVLRVIRMVQEHYEGSSRSIGMKNIKMILSGQSRLAVFCISIRSPIFAIRGAKASVVSAVKKWVSALQKKELVVYATVRCTAAATPSLLDVLDNTQEMSEKRMMELP